MTSKIRSDLILEVNCAVSVYVSQSDLRLTEV